MQWEFASGTTQGKDHRKVGKNNQDAVTIFQDPEFTVIVVRDGCGDSDSPYSEVGAHMGGLLLEQGIVRNLKRAIGDHYESAPSSLAFWEPIRLSVLAQLRVIAQQMGHSLSEIVRQYFLFTALCAVVTREVTTFVAIGDGALYVNGEYYDVGTYAGNAPPYLSYGLVRSAIAAEDLRFRVLCTLPTDDVASFLIGTDGAKQLDEVADLYIPGTQNLVGPISQFWTTDRYFTNRFAISHRLALINRHVTTVDWQQQQVISFHGLLNDDTTIAVGRRIVLTDEE